MDSTTETKAIAWATLFVASLSSSTAAAEPTLQDKSAAQALFDEGRAAMAVEHVAEACKKFSGSYDLDPTDGTLLNLALCHEKEGRTASAYAELGESVSRAIRDQRPEREKVAREHLAAVALRLSKLTVNVGPDSRASGQLSITVDGAPLNRAAWGIATPFDPGSHLVEAKAPGKRSWTATIALESERDSEQVEVPELADDPLASLAATPSTLPPRDHPASTDNPQRTLGWAAVGVGVAGVAIGSITGALAIGKWSGATTKCPNDVCASAADRAAFEGAGTLADVSTATYIAGGVGLLGGLVLLLTAPHAASPSRGALHVDPMFGAGATGVTLGGEL